MPYPHAAPTRRPAEPVEPLEPRLLLASVSGVVFNDLDANGVQGPGEIGLSGRRVYFDANANGRPDGSEPAGRTDSRGRYRFDGVTPGNGVVRQVLDQGFEQTTPHGDVSGFPFNPAPVRAGRFDIVFKAGPRLAANSAALSALNAAAAVWEQAFSDPVTVVIDVEIEPRDDNDDGVLATTTAEKIDLPYDQVRDLLAADASADEWSLTSALPLSDQFHAVLVDDPEQPFHFRSQVRATRANLKALGVAGNGLGAVRSRFDSAAQKDGSIVFNSAFDYDYTPADGVPAGRQDFFGIAVHEIGHVLGFDSAVDDVEDMMIEPSIERNVRPMPLDLYRLEAGKGAAGLRSAPRVLAPGNFVQRQVFFGGTSAEGLTFPGLRPGEVPLSTGFFLGDGDEASHWLDDQDGRPRVGVMDPSAREGRLGDRLTAADRRAFGLIGWDLRGAVPGQRVGVGAAGGAGEAVVNFGVRPANPDDQLAESISCPPGSHVDGDIYADDDVDVYRFAVAAGQRLGFDIDQFGGSLDPLVRLFDASGRQLASNDNAPAPGEAPSPGSYLEHTFTRGGVFFLGVSWSGNRGYDVVRGTRDVGTARASTASGRYALTLTDRTVDTNDQLAEALATRVGGAARQDISPERDVDLYRFTAGAGQRVGFDVDRPSRSALDPVLRLFDATGRQLALNDNGRAPGESEADAGPESYLEFTFSRAGTYYIGLSGKGNTRYDPRTGAGDVAGAIGGYILALRPRPAA